MGRRMDKPRMKAGLWSAFDAEVRNDTCACYVRVYTIAVSVFVVAMQCFYALCKEILPDFLGQGVSGLLFDILVGGVLFCAIFFVVRIAYRKYWIHSHKSMYLAGSWLHVHRQPDQSKQPDQPEEEAKPEYIRVGYVRIRQNFNDISVVSENFTPKLKNEDTIIKTGEYTHWRYKLARVENEETLALFSSTKVAADSNSHKGIHRLSVVCQDDKSGFPTVLGGEFSNVAPSNVRGSIRLYRISCGGKDSGVSEDTTEFRIEDMPRSWTYEVLNVLKKKEKQGE